MPNRKMSKKYGFQPGNTMFKNRTEHISEPNDSLKANPYVRLTDDQYKALITETSDGTISILDVHGNPAPIRILRRAKRKHSICDTKHGNNVDIDSEVYKIHHQGKLEQLYNDSFKEHAKNSSDCDGDIIFDKSAQRKWGLCWTEQMKCSKCSFVSKKTKLYTEVPKEGRGRKSAVPNVGLQVGLSQSMVSNTAARRIFMASHIPAPAKSAMQKCTNKVHEQIVKANQTDMQHIREQLHSNNEIAGLPRDAPIRVEGDGRYNNSLASGSGKTLFQAATQSVYTVVENQTNSKQIIAVSLRNKLCTTAQRLRNLGQNITCPEHPGHCSATAPPDCSLGNEATMSAACMAQLQNDVEPTDVKYCTLDGDSCAFQGYKVAFEEGKTKVCPEVLSDTRHLSMGQKRAMSKVQWSAQMFPESTKMAKDKLARRFCEDVAKQCALTFKLCYEACAGDTSCMIKKLTYATDAMLLCYDNDERLCKKGKSYSCSGTKKHFWNKPMLPSGYKLNMNEQDKEYLRQCIKYKLDRKAVLSQRFNTNSQKVESVNRAYTSTNPKCVTWTRNFPGRIHSAVHRVNNGPGKSTIKLLDAVGASLPQGSRIRRQLVSEDRRAQMLKDCMKSKKAKTNRVKTVLRNYAMYDKRSSDLSNPKTYQKGMHDRTVNKLNDHSYCKKDPKKSKKSIL